jgi:hypothetical protein
MGSSIGPKVPYDTSLVLNLDASNQRSYLGSGTAWNDLSGRNTNGVLSGTGNSLTVDGSGSTIDSLYFNGSANASLVTGNFNYGTNPRTIIVWARATGFNQYGHPFSYGTNGTNTATGIAQGNNGSAWGTYSSSVEFLNGGSTISLFTWYHVATTYDGTNATVYVNGSIIVGPSPRSYNVSQSLAYVGRYVGSNEDWIGNISQVLFYNRALSNAEINQIYLSQKSRYGL